MEYQCDVCKSHDTYVKLLTKTVFIKDKKIKISKERRFCKNCNCLVYDPVLDNEYTKEGIRLYNEKYGLPKEDIIAIRKKLNLSVEAFAKIIGCAKKTLVSYETGNSIPNDIYMITIKTIIDNPEVIKNIIEANKERYTNEEYKKINIKLNQFFSNNYDNLFSLNKDNEIYEFNGYTSFSKEKIINIIKILSKNKINKAKLIKEMFYIDFLSYNKYSCGITGLEYVKINYGPVPDNFEIILDYLAKKDEIDYNVIYHNNYEENIIQYRGRINYNIFSEKELDIINMVVEKFKDYSVSQIVEYSHKEKAFIDTKYKELISYDYALELNEF